MNIKAVQQNELLMEDPQTNNSFNPMCKRGLYKNLPNITIPAPSLSQHIPANHL